MQKQESQKMSKSQVPKESADDTGYEEDQFEDDAEE